MEIGSQRGPQTADPSSAGSPPVSPLSLLPGVQRSITPTPHHSVRLPVVADHELLRVIGRGAYGEVWLARHSRLGALRAVKIVRRDRFGDARPFQREFDGIRRYEPIS